MKTICSEDIPAMLEGVSKAFSDNKGYLVDIDSQIGDGDLGITMEKGFKALADFGAANSQMLPGQMLMRGGMEIIKTAPSTMGTLVGSGFMNGGKALGDKKDLCASDILLFFEGFLDGVKRRGKAEAGEKTIIDVLIPAIEEMQANHVEDINEMLSAAVLGAERGREMEKRMVSRHGKAAVFREKTRGLPDPGSEAIYIMIKAMRDSLS